MAENARFDAAYYQRFYEDPATRVADRQSLGRLGDFVCSYLKYLRIEVETVLDLGCGKGLWRPVLRRHFPRARYEGVEVSEAMCERHGWTRGSVVDFPCEAPADLVVCHGVLQYLPTRQCERAIRNLAQHTGQALYLEALTREDWEDNCDQDATDGDVHLRKASWYRSRLAQHFVPCGGGLFVPHDGDAVLYELERG